MATKTACDVCGTPGGDLVAIQSGQLLCEGCRALLGGGAKPKRVRRQIEFARTLGFDVSDSIPRPRLERLLHLHRFVRKYVFDVWHEMTGADQQASGVSIMEAMHFVTWLVTSNRPIALQIARAAKVREQMAKQEVRRLRKRLGPKHEVDTKKLKPRLLKDRAYRFVASELEQQLGSDKCKLGIASSLITGKKGSRARGSKGARKRAR